MSAMETFVELEKLYSWLETIPLSRQTKNLSRDFADGVLMAKICKHFFPKIVDLHNYPSANSHSAKVVNWETLNFKVFSKLQMKVTSDLIHQIAAGVPGALESVLLAVKERTENQHRQGDGNASPDAKSAQGASASTLAADAEVIKEIKRLKNDIQLINKTMAVLNQKVYQLENMLEVKDDCLRELTADIRQLKARKHESLESFSSFLAD